MNTFSIYVFVTLLAFNTSKKEYSNYPDGYFPFEKSPFQKPPKVRKPPYIEKRFVCPGVLEAKDTAAKSLDNLCGDLNDGYIPINPMGQKVYGHVYPFDLIRNHTLDFFSKSLPFLKNDKTIPKVAKYKHKEVPYGLERLGMKRQAVKWQNMIRKKRSTGSPDTDYNAKQNDQFSPKDLLHYSEIKEDYSEARGAKSFCEENYGILCIIYNTFGGKTLGGRKTATKREDSYYSYRDSDEGSSLKKPLTPCPSTVQYVTPVFARNYQGIWRYVVQIPSEGYFTQTVEVTQCLSKKCHYLSGSCLSSPRWVSFLVAEVYYPNSVFPNHARNLPKRKTSNQYNAKYKSSKKNRFNDFLSYTTFDRNVSGHCDGQDEIGCFQVRMYYDWFLVSGSCKCWKSNLYKKYRSRKT